MSSVGHFFSISSIASAKALPIWAMILADPEQW